MTKSFMFRNFPATWHPDGQIAIVREGELIGNPPNRWHLISKFGAGPVVTACGRSIHLMVAHVADRGAIEREKETSRIRRCRRCWKSPTDA